MTANHKLALAYEHRPDTGGRVSSVFVHRPDGHLTIASTGDWELSVILARLVINHA